MDTIMDTIFGRGSHGPEEGVSFLQVSQSGVRQEVQKCDTVLGQGVVYWVDLRVGGRRIRERIGPSRAVAEARELKLKQEKAKARALEESELAVTYRLEDLWPRYAAWCRNHNRDFRNKKLSVGEASSPLLRAVHPRGAESAARGELPFQKARGGRKARHREP